MKLDTSDELYTECELKKEKKKKKETRVWLQISQNRKKKDISKLISVHDSIIIPLSFGTLFIHIRPWMAAQQFCKSCENCFCPSWRCLRCMLALSLRELSQQSNNYSCIRTSLCILWQNFDEDNFDMLYKNDCWAAIQDPVLTINVPYKRTNKYAPTDNNFTILLFDFERFRIESRFPFWTHKCITISQCFVYIFHTFILAISLQHIPCPVPWCRLYNCPSLGKNKNFALSSEFKTVISCFFQGLELHPLTHYQTHW